jgi:hypothetical protein
MGVPSCALEVDMRSTRKETLDEIRNTIEPMFQAGVSAENARHGRKDGSDEAISLELMWYGLRPAFVADSVDNAAVHAGLQSGIQLGAINSPMVGTGSGSLNDNVPANTGVPTYQFSLASSAAGAGGHAFWEWGTRGAPATEVARMHRVLTAALIVSGFHAADGTVVQPSIGPIGKRTRDVVRHWDRRSRHAGLRPAVGKFARRVSRTRRPQLRRLWTRQRPARCRARGHPDSKGTARRELPDHESDRRELGQFDRVGRSHRAEVDRRECRCVQGARCCGNEGRG